ncbi:hypothetical protein [Streptomyces chartreusis]|uniref:hypothetical protein n=1 Tax=Streptomyces chartreusis TaxID=1969 RepID=UPI00362AD3B9
MDGSSRAPVVRDRHWPRELRAGAAYCTLLLALLLATDAVRGGLSPARLVLWFVLSALLLVVMVPARVSAGEGWIASHGVLSRTSVRTDRLVTVEWAGCVSSRLLLRDAAGRRIEVAASVLAANPLLWHLLEEGVRRSRMRGTLRSGDGDLRRLAELIDTDTVRGVFQASGLR